MTLQFNLRLQRSIDKSNVTNTASVHMINSEALSTGPNVQSLKGVMGSFKILVHLQYMFWLRVEDNSFMYNF